MPRSHSDFIERSVARLAGALDYAACAEGFGREHGFLQRLDPRVKLVGFLILIIAAVASHRLLVTLAIFSVGVGLACASGWAVMGAVARLWGGILLFTTLTVLPALFTTPGLPVWHLPWVGWTMTDHGLRSAVMLVARAETTATLAALMVFATPWAHLMKALRILRVPAVFVVILGMTHRYIFVLLQIAQDYFEARRVRQVGALSGRQRRRIAASTTGALLSKSVQLSSEVY